MPVEPKRMPFMRHFAELRRRIFIVLAVLAVLSFLFYAEPVYKFLLELFLRPVQEYLPNGSLTVLGPFEQMTFRFKVACYGALIAGMPVILFELFAFITPALKPKERRWVFPTVVAAILLFVGGVAFAYFVIEGPAFQWLNQQGAGVVTSLAAAGQYFTGISTLMLGFGIGFELPLVVFYLIGLNILPYDKVRGAWRYAYVIITIVAAVATPDWSPITMGGLAIALVALYELSLLAARIVFKKKIAEQRKTAAEEKEFYGDDDNQEEAEA